MIFDNFDNYTLVINKIYEITSVRTLNLLKSLEISKLEEFMNLESEFLKKQKYCGEKTVKEINYIQTSISILSIENFKDNEKFNAEDILKSKCFTNKIKKKYFNHNVLNSEADLNNLMLSHHESIGVNRIYRNKINELSVRNKNIIINNKILNYRDFINIGFFLNDFGSKGRAELNLIKKEMIDEFNKLIIEKTKNILFIKNENYNKINQDILLNNNVLNEFYKKDNQFKRVINRIKSIINIKELKLLNKLDINSLYGFMELDVDHIKKEKGFGEKTIINIEKIKNEINKFVISNKIYEGDVIQILNVNCLNKGILNDIYTKEIDQNILEAFYEKDDENKSVINAIKYKLKNKEKSLLEDLNVELLSDFMKIEKNELKKFRGYGKKTIENILNYKNVIKNYVLEEQIYEKNINDILQAEVFNNSKNIQSFLFDNENRTFWILTWINELAGKNKKYSHLYKLRYGLGDNKKETLESIGSKVGMTRERVRQICKKINIKIKSDYEQERLKPLYEEIYKKIDENVGIMSLSNLSKALFSDYENNNMFINVDIFLKEVLCNLVKYNMHFEDKQIKIKKENYGKINKIKKLFISEIKEKKEYVYSDLDLWKLDIRVIKKKLKSELNISYLDDLIISEVCNDLDYKYDSETKIVFSKNYYLLKNGGLIDKIFYIMKKENREMHFKEIAKELNKIGENYSEHNVYSCIGRDSDNNFLQWNPGSYVIKEKMQYPVELLKDIEKWAVNILKETPFVSLNGAYNKFGKRCNLYDINSEYGIYSWMRLKNNDYLKYPRLPYVYLKKSFKGNISILEALEYYVKNNDEVEKRILENYAFKKLCIKEFQLNLALTETDNIIKLSDNILIHKDNLIYDKDVLDSKLKEISGKTVDDYKISIEKIFNENEIFFISNGIKTTYLLYDIIKKDYSNLFDTKHYPYLIKTSVDRQKEWGSLVDGVERFISKANKPCLLIDIQKKFENELGYNRQSINEVFQKKSIFKYQINCLVHKTLIEWDSIKQNLLEIEAIKYYKESLIKGDCVGFISELVESNNLPELPKNVYWSESLLCDILRKGNNFKIFGNKKNIFIPIIENSDINDFDDVIIFYLEKNEDWRGVAKKSQFEEFLRKKKIIIKHITENMIGNKVIIKNNILCKNADSKYA